MLTEAQLRQIMPNLPAAKAALFLPHLNRAMAEYGIDSMLRTAAFVAQLAHESGEFRWMEEIWGPTDAQRRYEPVTDLSKRLGNTEPGDGKRFKGRGPIQLTGRANYQRFGGLLGIDLAGAPEQAAAPEAAFRVAALFWKNRGLNELADAQDFREITRRINGGFNGLSDRQKYFDRAKDALATGFEAGAQVATRGVAEATALPREVPAEPLTRGFEAIRELTAPKKRARKPAAKKPTAKKATAKKAPAKKPTTKQGAKKKAPARKPATKKTVSRNTTKKPSTTKAGKKKPAATKKPAKKVTAASRVATKAGKKASAKRPAARKPAAKKPSAASRALARRR